MSLVKPMAAEASGHGNVDDAWRLEGSSSKSPSMWEQKARFKVCLLGEHMVGKTSLSRRYVSGTFYERYLYTLGTALAQKDVWLLRGGRGTFVASLTIWDIMGQKEFLRRVMKSYFEGTDGAVAVCDLSRPDTCRMLRDWLDVLSSVVGPVPVVHVANKADLVERDGHEGVGMASHRNHANAHLVTSAKTGEGVDAAFQQVAEMIAGERVGGTFSAMSKVGSALSSFRRRREG